MCSLAVFLERAGIATIVVGLTRLHIEKIRPPRALWVPFALGRPLGGPVISRDFKRDVLRAAFNLLDRSDGPILLEDFSEEDPSPPVDVEWQKPDLSSATSLSDEIKLLMPLWQRGVERFGRTMTGLGGLPIEAAADYIDRFGSDDPAPNPGDDLSDLLRMRFCADDLKIFYTEAALAEKNPGSDQIGDWFWSDTRAAATLNRIRLENMDSEDSTLAMVCGNLLVPGARK